MVCIVTLTTTRAQQSEIYNYDGIAINGYDAVAYFNESKPVKGIDTLWLEWKGVKWLFSNKENTNMIHI